MSFSLDPQQFSAQNNLFAHPQEDFQPFLSEQRTTTTKTACQFESKSRSPLTQITRNQKVCVTEKFSPSSQKQANEEQKRDKIKKKNERIIILKTNQKLGKKNPAALSKADHKISNKQNNEEREKRNQSEEVDRLLVITSRCVDYYNKFVDEKEMEVKVVQSAFKEINTSLEAAFTGIIREVQQKYDEIANFLGKKETELVKLKEDQQKELKSSLQNIKSVHLTNILGDCHSENIPAKCCDNISEQISSYANTLHSFYQAMEGIERSNYKESVEQTINFINNLITEELKFIIYDRIPHKSSNCSFSFNEGVGIAESRHQRIDPSIVSSTFELQDKKNNQNKNIRNKQLSEAWCQTIPWKTEPQRSYLSEVSSICSQQEKLSKRIEVYSHFL